VTTPRWRLPLLMVVGVLLAECAWMLAVPAFRGVDEFDHVYRAAAVARGEWQPSGDLPANGRGELLTVPRDIVAAAGPECRARPYTGPDNCAPVDTPADELAGGQVRVASAASRYQPVYYWVVGTAARWTSGTDAVLVMRAVSALLCALFVGLAAWTLGRWARTGWPAVALVGSLTPVVAYSSVVVAPNALEMVAGTSVWVALAGLKTTGLAPRTERALLWAAVPGAVLLANLRSLGIGFLGLTVLVMLTVLGRRRVVELVRRHTGTVLAATLVVTAAVVAGLGWLLAARPNQIEEHANNTGALTGTLIQLPVWVLQTIAAAPGRSDPAPLVVYLLCGAVLGTFAVLGLRRAEPAVRRGLLVVAVLSLALPFVMTLRTFRDAGVIWQGRYGMPFSVGVLVLAGLALDRVPGAGALARTPSRVATLVGMALFGAGQLVAVLYVLDMQRRVSPSVEAGLWSAPSPWLVGALTLAGWALVTVALLRAGGPRSAAGGAVAVDELPGQLLEEQSDVGDDAARL
jgi:hypothetical protein